MKRFSELTEEQIVALAISLEEEDARFYRDYARALEEHYPASAEVLREMAKEEDHHRQWLIDLHRKKFGEHIPLIRRQDVHGFVQHKPVWLMKAVGPERVRKQVEEMEYETRRFYEQAMSRATDAGIRKLLGDLAQAEQSHEVLAEKLEAKIVDASAEAAEKETRRRLFVLQIVQPGLAGLMDGSVSTLAPIFAAAFATHDTWATFLVGLAASIGAGISMGFAEALSDDGSLTGRGHPWLRGLVTGAMTAIGGLGHTLPFLIGNFWTAFVVACVIVVVELWAIAWVRARYMDTRFLQAVFEVVLGGTIVFATGVLIGSA
ncbi:ferritin family protein [Methyloligella sp. 2.7D]|uniref:iron exporter MbfA n=1 Tax=unclassified Methyloligella TaxID=2625955 RepID=UPI00157D5B25|nr:ferritin family protein [Methyloligella sp. GL2]QKP76093.1 rubrerythrin [Methyloligella sp. GL2]